MSYSGTPRSEAKSRLTELAARTLVIVADPNYFAINLYRAVGFTPTQTQLQIGRRPSRD